MKISAEEITSVVKLARLNLEPAQIKNLTIELDNILINIDKLAQVDTKGIPPTYHVLTIKGNLREDLVYPSLERNEVFANAPVTDGKTFIVPKII